MRQARQPAEKEKQQLLDMKQKEVGRIALRAQMILLSVRGFSVPNIAHILDTSDVTIYKWIERFNEDGPDGLYDLPRSGRPPKVDDSVKETIQEVLNEPPVALDYNFNFWTVPLLTQHLQETFDRTFCRETIRRSLHALDFRWRRPRWSVEREDPEAADLMWAICEAVLDAPEETRIFIQDETIFKTLPPLRHMWMRKGEQVRIPTPIQNKDVHLYGALELNSGEIFSTFHPKGRSEYTICYLEQLEANYPEQQILVLWDQARYHTSKAVTEWLEQHPRITTMLLPKYAADLNPIEAIWRHLKNRVAANLTRSLKAIKEAVIRFFKEHQPIELLKMAGLQLDS